MNEPYDLSLEEYRLLHERVAIACRVVEVNLSKSWTDVTPTVKEDDAN